MPRNVHAAMRESAKPQILRVIHRHGMVTDCEELEAGVRKFVGVSMCRDTDADGKPTGNHGQFMTADLVVELPKRKEYLMALAEGHLVGADEATARLAHSYARSVAGSAAKDLPGWETFLATKDELKLHSDTVAAMKSQDDKNESEAKRVAQKVANPLPDPSKLAGGKLTNTLPEGAPLPDAPPAQGK